MYSRGQGDHKMLWSKGDSILSAATVIILVFRLGLAFTQDTTQPALFAGSKVNTTSDKFEPIPLYIGTLQPTSVHWWAPYGRFFVDFLQWVFDDINTRKDILPGYVLRLEWRDTQGEAGLAARQMFELLTTGQPKVAICGVGLSDELVIVGNVAQYYSLPLLSFSAQTSNSLNRDGFQSVYITNYLGESANLPFLAIMEYFGWSRVATIIYKDVMFETQIVQFHRMVKERNMTLVTSAVVTDTDQAEDSLKRLKQFGARIIVGAFRAGQAPYIFCQAYHQGLYGPSYVWLLTGTGMYDRWIGLHFDKPESTHAPCTREQIQEASRGYLAVDNVYLRPDTDVVTVAGMTAAEYAQKATDFSMQSDYIMSRTAPYAFDAAWALALTLNRTQSRLSQGALNATRLEDFDYSRQDLFNLNLESLEEISFEGVSGPVSFTSDGRRLGPQLISRYDGTQDAKTVVGSVTSDNTLTWNLADRDLFYGYAPPRDRVLYETRLLPPSTGAIAVVLVLNCLGITADLAFLTFNILYRKNSHIKMSSPLINNVILLGGFLMYIFVFVLTADYAQWSGVYSDTVCSVRTVLAYLGFTVAFGALFSKTWRVHALFTNNQMKRKVIRDSKLLSLVLVLVLVDLVILIPWSVVQPLRKVESRQEASAESTQDKIVTYIHTTCSHPNEIYWYMAEYIVKGLLLVFGAFLAWETRKVTIPALNDSKLIGFCIYNIAVVCALAVPVVHGVGQDKPTLTYLLVGLFVSLCTTLVLCILFIPKVRLRNQVAERRFVSSLHAASRPGDSQCHTGSHVTQLQPPGATSGLTSGVVTSTCTTTTHHGHPTDLLAVPNGSAATNVNRAETDHRENNEVCPSIGSAHEPQQPTEEVQSLESEVARLSASLTEELQAVADLSSALLVESHGKLQFRKVGKDYVIFKDEESKEIPPKQETAHGKELPSTTASAVDFKEDNINTCQNVLETSA